MKNKITAVVLCKNEEGRIARCVSSLKAVDSLVVIDSFSTDLSFEKARQAWLDLGKADEEFVFLSRAWDGFTAARNVSLDYVRTEWVLWIDADEWVEEDLHRSLSSLEKLSSDVDVFRIARLSEFLGRKIRHGGWYPDRKARLARASNCEWKAGPRQSDVHEDLWPKKGDKRAVLAGHLGHLPFVDEAEQQQTNERYSTLLAQGLARDYATGKKRPFPKLLLPIKVFIKFLENYLWKRGFLDGKPGLKIAIGSAQSLSWRLEKARRMYQNEEPQ